MDDRIVLALIDVNFFFVLVLETLHSVSVTFKLNFHCFISHSNEVVNHTLESFVKLNLSFFKKFNLFLNGLLNHLSKKSSSLIISLVNVALKTLDIVLNLDLLSFIVQTSIIALIRSLCLQVNVHCFMSASASITCWSLLILAENFDSWRSVYSIVMHKTQIVGNVNSSKLNVIACSHHVSRSHHNLVFEGKGIWAPVGIESDHPHVLIVLGHELVEVVLIKLDESLIEGGSGGCNGSNDETFHF